MPERCPLGGGINWNNRNQIPDECMSNCQSVWESASRGKPAIDIIASDCMHDVEFEDESLQRLDGPRRLYGILSVCRQSCGEAFAEEWEFDCPYN